MYSSPLTRHAALQRRNRSALAQLLVLLLACGAAAGCSSTSSGRRQDGSGSAEAGARDAGVGEGSAAHEAGARLDAGTGDSGTGDAIPAELAPLLSPFHPHRGAAEDEQLIAGLIEGFIDPAAEQNVIYVAPPQGSADGVGSKSDPRRDLLAVVKEAVAGDRIYLAPGDYDMTLIRDTFGHNTSMLRPGNSGVAGNPIVISTDPDLFDAAAGQIAVLDFKFQNQLEDHRTWAFDVNRSYWLIEQLEIKNTARSALWVIGSHNLIRNNHIHHGDIPGVNNHALIAVATRGHSYNVIMGNHLHHQGVIDHVTLEVTDSGGLNGGCTYSETRQGYEDTLSELGADFSYQDYLAHKGAPDGHVYFYNNLLHDCRAALATKNTSEGPFFMLSNVAYDVTEGVKITLGDSVVRNNIIYKKSFLHSGILIGWSNCSNALSQLGGGHNITVRNNTVVGAKGNSMGYYSGWDGQVRNNVFIQQGGETHRFWRHSFPFLPEEISWPGAVGEYLFDIGPANPYWQYMPRYMRDLSGVYKRIVIADNAYSETPSYASVDPEIYDFPAPSQIETAVTVSPADALQAQMRDPANHDYRRQPGASGLLASHGSQLR